MKTGTKVQLTVMMFLQYFIWGAWYVTLGTYLFTTLKADAVQVGSAYATFSIAAVISPFFTGLIADRFFAAQRVMAVLHITGAVVLWLLSGCDDTGSFWWLLLLYTLCYTPTISLANTVAFGQMADGGKEFPVVRVFGTLGWIAAGLLIGLSGVEATAAPFRIAAVSAALLGVFCVVLPDTPPAGRSGKSVSSILGAEALVLLKDRSFLLFFIASVLICIPLSFYYNFTNAYLNDTGFVNAAGKMSLGQVSEVVFMLLIPLLFNRLGVKKMLMIAVACWVARYLLFAFGNTGDGVWMLYGGILLHGICYDFFFVTGQIYTDQKAPSGMRGSAQGMLTLSTYGLGMLAGSFLSGVLTEQYAKPAGGSTAYDWQMVWLIPALIAFCILVMITLFFKNKAVKATAEGSVNDI